MKNEDTKTAFTFTPEEFDPFYMLCDDLPDDALPDFIAAEEIPLMRAHNEYFQKIY